MNENRTSPNEIKNCVCHTGSDEIDDNVCSKLRCLWARRYFSLSKPEEQTIFIITYFNEYKRVHKKEQN